MLFQKFDTHNLIFQIIQAIQNLTRLLYSLQVTMLWPSECFSSCNSLYSMSPGLQKLEHLRGSEWSYNFCDLQQETISLSSLPVCHTVREWQKDLTLEHTMCFAEPVLGGTRGHGRDPSHGGVLVRPCPALFGGNSERQGWEGRGSFTLVLVSGDILLSQGSCWALLAVMPVYPVFTDLLDQFL